MIQARDDCGLDDESTLLKRVRESSHSIAAYDVVEPAVLAVSDSARAQLGFFDADLAALDIVDGSSDPDGVRSLLALIRDGQLEEWKFRCRLHTPDGETYWEYGTGRVVDVGSRRVGVVSYPSPGSKTPPRDQNLLGEHEEVSDRVGELEEHLRRIFREVEAAGLAPGFTTVASARPESPDFANLSSREVEIATRILRGERVPTIAKSLYLSPSTVRNHLCSIYRKFGIHSQVELIEILQEASGRPLPMK